MRFSTSSSTRATRCPTAAGSRSRPPTFVRCTSQAREREMPPGAYVLLAVSDTGPGMSAGRHRARLRPVLHDQADRSGHRPRPVDDLRLRQAVGGDRSGSTRRSGVGTTVRLYLPRYRGEIAEHEATRRHAAPRRRTAKPSDRRGRCRPSGRWSSRCLRDLGYRDARSRGRPVGPARPRGPTYHIDLLVTDVGLPGSTAGSSPTAAREARPELKVLFITGYAENATFGTGQLDPGHADDHQAVSRSTSWPRASAR